MFYASLIESTVAVQGVDSWSSNASCLIGASSDED